MSPRLIDNYGREVNYLRLAVTERCNLHCQYCKPSENSTLTPQDEILSWQEMLRLCQVFVKLGIRKIRITGGEPFVRKGLINFLSQIQGLPQRPEIAITTNGVLAGRYLDDLACIGIRRLNISLDSLNENTFRTITRNTQLHQVMKNLELAYLKGFNIKINMVVLPGINDKEIPQFVDWTRNRDWTIRFIEPMPFDTYGGQFSDLMTGKEILDRIRSEFEIHPIPTKRCSVECLYQVNGYQGKISIINGFTRSFCQGCSRLRVSSRGLLRTCLYGRPVLDLREMLRANMKNEQLAEAIKIVINHRKKNGFEAAMEQEDFTFDSMSVIGG